jgi:hypothetical protein
MPEMPKLMQDLLTLTFRLPVHDTWKRLRIAVTREELNSFKVYDGPGGEFIRAIRGIPLQIEENPTNPTYMMELPCPPNPPLSQSQPAPSNSSPKTSTSSADDTATGGQGRSEV